MDLGWATLGASALSGLANIGGGLFSAGGAAQQNQMQMQFAQNMQQQQNAFNAHQAFLQRDAASGLNAVNNEFASDMAAAGREFSNWQADKAMGFSERMANTAYQRAMVDMKKAGLNPILAYQQGGGPAPQGTAGSAGSPGGGGGSMSAASGSAVGANFVNEKGDLGRAIGNAVSSAVDAAKTFTGIDLMQSQGKLTDENTRKVGYETTLMDRQADRTIADTNVLKQEYENRKLMGNLITANTAKTMSEAGESQERIKQYKEYGAPHAPNTVERLLRSLQGYLQQNGPVMPAPAPWDNSPRIGE